MIGKLISQKLRLSFVELETIFWNLYFDDFDCKEGASARSILTNPKGNCVLMAICRDLQSLK